MSNKEVTDDMLMSLIRLYWSSRGYKVKVEMRECPENTKYKSYAVRSDLINGVPRGYRGIKEALEEAS
jgi:hypothetical protein